MGGMDGGMREAAPVPRRTPYELAFGAGVFEADRFPAIREEAEARGVEASDPARFVLLGTVGALLQELAPESAESGAGGVTEASAVARYGALLFQAYQFWRFGRRVYVLEERLARRLVDPGLRVGEWALVPPHPAGYLQLPRHLFWARIEEAATPEPVDGFFWTMVGVEDPFAPPYRRLDVLLVLGMRAGRPGFSTIAVGTELVSAPLGHWADADGRPDGGDFGNILPGGELQDWFGLVTEVEALKLVSRIFWYMAVHPDAVTEEVRLPEGGAGVGEVVPATALPFHRVREVSRAAGS